MQNERNAYKATQRNGGGGRHADNRQMQEFMTSTSDAMSVLLQQIQTLAQSVPNNIQFQDGNSTIATGVSHHNNNNTNSNNNNSNRSGIMGGRNEQNSKSGPRQQRQIDQVKSTARKIGRVSSNVNEPIGGEIAMNECDTNADTCYLGTNFQVLAYTRRVADVYAYDASIEPIENIPIVTGATAWDDPATGETLMLVFYELLYYHGTKLDHSLINPNQVRSYGIPFWDNPFDEVRGLCVELDETTIKMKSSGTKIYFETRAPTDHELDTCQKIDMTSQSEWNPREVKLSEHGNTSSQIYSHKCTFTF